MIETTAFQTSIKKVIRLAKKIDREIGSYISHRVAPNGDYTATLSNGEIDLPFDIILSFDKKKENPPGVDVVKIASTFRKE